MDNHDRVRLALGFPPACEDCKWLGRDKATGGPRGTRSCGNPAVAWFLSHNARKQSITYPEHLRRQTCGPDGVFWEPKNVTG
jgi:hypothetical protein